MKISLIQIRIESYDYSNFKSGKKALKQKHYIIVAAVLLLTVIVIAIDQGYYVMHYLMNSGPENITVVIDAGHGGFDPGKVGINQALEKNINLSVAYKLKKLLEQENITVVMTRKDENGLYKKNDTDKKRTDMNNRIRIINGSGAAFAVSIHQNSFTQESSWGAQVFYYEASEKGKALAELLQETIKNQMKDGNHRLAKPNSTYFLLRHSNCPLVIVECGFLTNRREAELLCEDSYQDKMAEAIFRGLMSYINQTMEESNYTQQPMKKRN